MDAGTKQAMYADLSDLYLDWRLNGRSSESYTESVSKVKDEYKRDHNQFRTKDQGW